MDNSVVKQKLFEALHQHFITLVNKHKTLDRLGRDFGLDTVLTGSEIHTIEAIGQSSITNVTDLAQSLGITKAAASQTVAKIYKNGFIRKLKDDNNKREVLLSLTEKGKQAYQGHKQEWDWSCETFLSDLSTEQIQNFNTVAEKVIDAIDCQIEKSQPSK